jgi:CheY-like chemotaxis protein
MNYVEPTKKTILVVEDEIDLLSLYVEVLQDAGFAVEQAQDGNIAMEKIKSVMWDAMLLDIMLPGQDGLTILKTIATTPNLKKGPIIITTNLNNDYVIQDAFKYGADGFLIKSEITPDKVIEEVTGLVRK